MYEPYDYVLTSNGVLGVFRAYTESGDVAFRPVYRCSAGGWTKLTPRMAAALPGRRHPLLDRDCALAGAKEVKLLTPCRARPVGAAGSSVRDHPAVLRGLLSALLSRGARVYLYGSRLLGLRSYGSDWDFVVDHEGDLAELLGSCLGQSCAFLGPREFSSIAASYESNTAGSARRDDVLRILGKSWCALRVAGRVVDFFLTGTGGPAIPDVLPGRLSLVDCAGVVQPSAGSSFRMPRKVCIRTSTARTVNVHHVSWILCGLERMAGSRVTLRDVLAYGPADVWLSPWTSKLSLDAQGPWHATSARIG
ncbi:nucleotidyltransferase domain-containing protein [Nonomuraea candida]|uniref:nucleotidyltransferase domain-containing protein n=1 Tax=Nonomuraea candida TaxID=359159 RepID=UPI0005B971A7|nr:nucleotidyltransferase domain-containing protein [Nonomuraea candida]